MSMPATPRGARVLPRRDGDPMKGISDAAPAAAARFAPPRDGVVRGVCPHDCPDCCSVLYHVRDGRLCKIEGNPDHPSTRGFICRKFASAPARVHAAARLQYPLRRRGPKGEGQFERISWSTAIDEISGRWRAIVADSGPQAILPFFGSGTEGLVNGRIAGRRFFNRLGTLQLERTICTKAGRTGFDYTMGASVGADPRAIVDAELVILWGCAIAHTNIHQQALVREARARGAKLIVINPVQVKGTGGADLFLQPRPGTDAAIALALMHVMFRDGLHDPAFMARHTLGFDALRERAADYAPAIVADIAGVAAADLEALAACYAGTQRSFIYIGPGCQRHSNGGMTVRTLACLPALTGAWAHRGGGAYFPTSTIFPVHPDALEGDSLRPTPPAGYNMIELGALLTEPAAGVRSLYVFNGNPAATLYHQARLRCGLAREDLFTVVHEQYLTDTAKYADIVLPATSHVENLDLQFSYYHFDVMLNRPAIAPPGESRSNLDTFRSLAVAMGFDEPCFRQSAWEVIEEILALEHPALQGIDVARLLAEGWCAATVETACDKVRQGRFPTRSGRIELYSQRMADDGFDPLPAYVPLRESRECTPALVQRYPLYLLTASTASFHKSSHAHARGWARWEARPTLVIHPHDAEARGIADGDEVRVFNDRGDFVLWAAVDHAVRRGVVAAPGLWWDACYPARRNANHTTPDATSDMGGGSSFNTNLVEVARRQAASGAAHE